MHMTVTDVYMTVISRVGYRFTHVSVMQMTNMQMTGMQMTGMQMTVFLIF